MTAGRRRPTSGPLIHEAAREKVERYVAIGQEEGAELVTGGKPPGGRLAKGYFYQPTIFAGVKQGAGSSRRRSSVRC